MKFSNSRNYLVPAIACLWLIVFERDVHGSHGAVTQPNQLWFVMNYQHYPFHLLERGEQLINFIVQHICQVCF